MSSTFISTDEVPAADRADFVREALSVARTTAVELLPVAEAGFRLRLRYSDLGAMRVIQRSASPYRVRRTRALIRDADPDLLAIGLPLRGRATVSQYDRQFHAPTSSLFLWDVRQPYSARFDASAGPVEFLALHFPRELLPLPTAQLEKVVATPLPASQGIGALTSQLMVELASGMDHFTPAEATRLSVAALDVLATRLAGALDGDRWLPPETHTHALLVRIHAFIQQHLGNPELSPGAIAAAHHISTRYLHMLFKEQGLTVAGWVRQRRLEGARRDLAEPSRSRRPVGAIGARWGFSSPSQFSQVFKATYGTTPRDYRQQALAAPRQQFADPKELFSEP